MVVDINTKWKKFLTNYANGDNRLKFLVDFGNDSFLWDLNILEMIWSEESDETLNVYFSWTIECRGIKGKVHIYVDYSKEETGFINYEMPEYRNLPIPLLRKLEDLYRMFEKDSLQFFNDKMLNGSK